MLVLLRASADGASPISRLRPRPVPLMVAAAEEPVLRPQLKGAAALTGTATGVAVSGFKVAALGLAAALYAGPLALPELPGSELGPYVLVRPAPPPPLPGVLPPPPHPACEPRRRCRSTRCSAPHGCPPPACSPPAHSPPVSAGAPVRLRRHNCRHAAPPAPLPLRTPSRLHVRVVQVPALGGLASYALCAAVSPPEDEPRAGAGSAADVSYGSPRPEPRSGTASVLLSALLSASVLLSALLYVLPSVLLSARRPGRVEGAASEGVLRPGPRWPLSGRSWRHGFSPTIKSKYLVYVSSRLILLAINGQLRKLYDTAFYRITDTQLTVECCVLTLDSSQPHMCPTDRVHVHGSSAYPGFIFHVDLWMLL